MLLDDGTAQQPLRLVGVGEWTAAWAPDTERTSTSFVKLTMRLPEGQEYHWVAWVDDLAELRHATRGKIDRRRSVFAWKSFGAQ